MFKNREEAARLLVEKLNPFKNRNLVVLAIPRGGVVVGKVLSERMGCPLEILVVKKIGAPYNPELAIGAVGPDNTIVWNKEIVVELGLTKADLAQAAQDAKQKTESYQAKFFAGERLDLKDKTVILTDDGIATGATVEAAITWIKKQKPNSLILAVPVAPSEMADKFKNLVDEFITLETPSSFGAVGQFYEDFPQVSDEDVIKLLLAK